MQKIAVAMDRDGIAFGTLPYWTTADNLSMILEAVVAQQKSIDDAKAAEAKIAAEQKAKELKADADRKAAELKSEADKKAAEAKICKSTNLEPCTEEEICKKAVTQQGSSTVWGNKDFEPWVSEAKAKGYRCGATGEYVARRSDGLDMTHLAEDLNMACLSQARTLMLKIVDLGWVENRPYWYQYCKNSGGILALLVAEIGADPYAGGVHQLMKKGHTISYGLLLGEPSPLCYNTTLGYSYQGDNGYCQ